VPSCIYVYLRLANIVHGLYIRCTRSPKVWYSSYSFAVSGSCAHIDLAKRVSFLPYHLTGVILAPGGEVPTDGITRILRRLLLAVLSVPTVSFCDFGSAAGDDFPTYLSKAL
jgi:hypothetical protein